MHKERKPKALIFYTYLPPWRVDVFNEMNSYYDLTIVFLFKSPEGMEYDQKLLSSKLKADHFFHELGFNIGSRQFRVGILNIIKKYKPEIVFSHEYSPTSILISLFLRLQLFNFKYVITTSDNLSMAETTGTYRKYARSFVLGAANGIVVYNLKVKEWYANKFGHLQIEVCPNIQNPDTLKSNNKDIINIVPGYTERYNLSNDKVLLYVGRLAQEKGLDLLLTAFSKLKTHDFKLVLVGEGNKKKALQEMTLDLGISERVIFPGRFDGPHLYAWYKLADLFILPSTYEPFGAVVNEALIFGAPVLASKYIGALDYIKEGYNGVIFDPLDEEDFINTLHKATETNNNKNSKDNNLMLHEFDYYVKVFSKFI